MSSLPNFSTVLSTSFLQILGSRTSPIIGYAVRPSASTARLVSSASCFSSFRNVNATSAPSRAKSTATARPIPESPPVIKATLSFSLPAPAYRGAWCRGRGFSFASMPGFGWCCAGIGERGSSSLPLPLPEARFFGARRPLAAFDFTPFLPAINFYFFLLAFFPPLLDELVLLFFPRPLPLFLPPPVSLFTVAHARRSDSFFETPLSS